MRRMPATVFPLLVTLALSSPSRAVGGPPERASGEMLFVDKVAEGLRRYHQEEDWAKRTRWLEALAPTRDPRVGVVLGKRLELFDARGFVEGEDCREIRLFTFYYGPPDSLSPDQYRSDELERAMDAWKARKAELRRRAARLPQ